jgi:hypothetical protein
MPISETVNTYEMADFRRNLGLAMLACGQSLGG